MENELLKEQLKNHLFGGQAFLPVDEMLKKISFDQISIRPQELPYSFYEIFYHIWFTQRDILKYCTEADYKAPQWPDDYWPHKIGAANKPEWRALKNAFFEDRDILAQFILSTETDMLKAVPSHKEHSILREVLLVIEHTAYHSGQLLIILRHLGLHTS